MPQDQGPQVSVRFRRNEIRRRREREGWTQECLASQTGISLDTCRRAERGDAVSEAVDFTAISNPAHSVNFWGFIIREEETSVLVFSCLQLASTMLKVIERMLKDVTSRNR
jgi:transcriptional regulator with XRE-family HTH domain